MPKLTRDVPFRPCPAGPELVFPLSRHIGKPAPTDPGAIEEAAVS